MGYIIYMFNAKNEVEIMYLIHLIAFFKDSAIETASSV